MEQDSITTQVAILGGGPAGYVAAIRAAQRGATTLLIESDVLGGVCLNRGCIPTKALLKSAQVAVQTGRSSEFGVRSTLEEINWNTAVKRKDRVVKSLQTGLSSIIAAREIKALDGYGTVLSPQKIEVQTKEGVVTVHCEKLILATGSIPAIPPIEGMELAGVIDSTEALELDEMPESIAILGAGVIGTEFATMFSSLGSKVTLIEQAGQLLPGTDEEVATRLQKTMKRQKVGFKLSQTVVKVEDAGNGLRLYFENGESLECEKLLVATGRKSQLSAFSSLGLATENGVVTVNERLETSVPGVYAAGDLIGGQLLAHLAFAEGRTAADNALGDSKAVNYNAVPSCIYSNPEYAVVGITEQQAAQQGIQVIVGRYDFRGNGRAQTLAEREGFVKIVADENGIVIGGQIFGAEASEMISELTLAIACGASLETLADLVHPHPTLNEAIWEASCSALGKGIHSI